MGLHHEFADRIEAARGALASAAHRVEAGAGAGAESAAGEDIFDLGGLAGPAHRSIVEFDLAGIAGESDESGFTDPETTAAGDPPPRPGWWASAPRPHAGRV